MAQVFDGGYQSSGGVAGAPFKSGFDFQGWAYGTGTFDRMIDYMMVVKSVTGENLPAAHRAWLSAILRAEKEALQPDGFQIDVRGEWGGDYGAIIDSVDHCRRLCPRRLNTRRSPPKHTRAKPTSSETGNWADPARTQSPTPSTRAKPAKTTDQPRARSPGLSDRPSRGKE
jgi:hypothetical protein